jgi:hypothetical protein
MRRECKGCDGRGYHVYVTGYTVTGSGYGDAREAEEERACEACIARACAVLVARGVTREEVEGE